MRDKPRIYKADDGWSVDLPAFGFASREAAGGWLAKHRNVGSSSQVVERASAARSRYPDMNVPMVIR